MKMLFVNLPVENMAAAARFLRSRNRLSEEPAVQR